MTNVQVVRTPISFMLGAAIAFVILRSITPSVEEIPVEGINPPLIMAVVFGMLNGIGLGLCFLIKYISDKYMASGTLGAMSAIFVYATAFLLQFGPNRSVTAYIICAVIGTVLGMAFNVLYRSNVSKPYKPTVL